jgi:hypothetical protein
LIFGSYLALRFPASQTWITQRIASYLSVKLNTKVEVKGVDIEFFKKIVLEGVYIEDQHKDTLLYADAIKVDIMRFSLKNNKYLINSISLNKTVFKLKKYKNETTFNYNFIVKAFASNDTSKKTGKPINMYCGSVKLNNVTFVMRDENEPLAPIGVDYFNIYANHIYGSVDEIYNTQHALLAKVNKLSFHDRSGFIMKELSMETRLGVQEISCNRLILKTPYTNLYTNLSFIFKQYPDWLDYNNKVTMKAKLMTSEVSMKDIAYFAPYLTGMDNLVKISGNVLGTVNNLSGKNMSIYLGKATVFRGNVAISGLPNVDATKYDLDIFELKTNKEDIETISYPPFNLSQCIALPDNISTLGNIVCIGKFKGLFSNFTASAHIKTDIGEVIGDVAMNYTNKTPLSYKSHIATVDFDLGCFLGQETTLGNLTASANIKGTDFSINKMIADLNGNINSFTLNGYTYKNIQLTSKANKGAVNVKLAVNEDNLNLNFDGNVNLKNESPRYDFIAQLKNIRLNKLKLINRDESSSLSTTIMANFSGTKIENLVGNASFENTTYHELDSTYIINHINLISSITNNNKNLSLTSDYVDANINGIFNLVTFQNSFINTLDNYIDGINFNRSKPENDQQFYYSATLKNTSAITNLLVPGLQIAPNTIIKGNYNDLIADFNANILSDYIKYADYTFIKLTVDQKIESNIIKANAVSQRVLYKDSVLIDLAKITINSNEKSLDFRLELGNLPNHNNKADIKGNIAFKGKQGVEGKFLPSTIVIDNQSWKIDSKNLISLDSTKALTVANLKISNNTQSIDVGGKYTTKKGVETAAVAENPLQILLTNFNLNNFSKVLKSFSVDVAGITNGKVLVYSNANGKIGLSSNLKINKLKFNGDSLGTATINSTWDAESGEVGLIANIVRGTAKIVDISGKYSINDKKNALKFDVIIDKVYLQMIDKYVDKFISNLKGIISANLHIEGTFTDPAITGKAKLQKTSFTFNYLNTSYNLSDEFEITDHDITISKVALNDSRGNVIIADGKIYHDKFKNFRFDIGLNANNVQVMNTTIKQNDVYYGTAYASGKIALTGTIDNFVVNMAMKTEKGTQIFIPLTGSEEVSETNFVTFINKKIKTNKKAKPSYIADLSGIALNIDLEVTPEAEVQIIFDSKIGDKIKGSGAGNIKLEINTLGDFNMYGDYSIYKGSYTFTLQNLVNKAFSIQRGGSIRWNGNPLQAEIDISAIYKTNAPLYQIIPDDDRYRTAIPIECKIRMTNKLLNPTITYDINIPNIDETTNALVRSNIARDGGTNAMTNQVISLLLFNRFAPTGSAATAANNNYVGTGLSTSGSELLSSQLSNWASQIGKVLGADVNIGVNYRPKDELNSKQLEVIYSTQIFNERLIVNGNVGQASTYTNSRQNANNIVGDFTLEYKVSKDGRFRLKAFNLSNNNTLIKLSTADYKQGLGVFYREEFDTFDELLKRYKRKAK